MDTEVTAIFVDIRGFTKWAENIETFPHIEVFIKEFYSILKNYFADINNNPAYFKPLGDGALIVHEMQSPPSISEADKVLTLILYKINSCNKIFDELCTKFCQNVGVETTLNLGWGIVRGSVKKTKNDNGKEDYIGSNINKCARMCDVARPWGIVIDKYDFPNLPPEGDVEFYTQKRKIKGVNDYIDVWVTEQIANQFIGREYVRQFPEVHIAGVCVRNQNGVFQVLIAKRSKERRLYPGLYEGCGGQLAYSESFIEGVKRHYLLEMSIGVEVFQDIHKFYEIKEPNEPLIPGIRFLCEYKNGNPYSANHDEIKWVTKEELEKIPKEEFIPGLKDHFQVFLIDYIEKTKR
ncbi:MAG: NUDIX domain-containing protein [Candidatus Atribacteria bacterium]|nr:NUDIX domain-containing protein [Candidatus Atribacteria bacterium]